MIREWLIRFGFWRINRVCTKGKYPEDHCQNCGEDLSCWEENLGKDAVCEDCFYKLNPFDNTVVWEEEWGEDW